LPLVFLVGFYLKATQLNFPPLRYGLIAALLAIFIFPLKEIGKKIQKGEQIELIEVAKESIDGLLGGETGDLSFIEQSGAMIGSIDDKNTYFWGTTYLPTIFFWIPRSLWADKPALNFWQKEISTSGRDYAKQGQVSLLSGEAYANFSYVGAFMVPLCLGYFYGLVYRRAMVASIRHRHFLLLLLLNMILFQVWRDGLISLFVFPFINYFPLTVLYLIKKYKEV